MAGSAFATELLAQSFDVNVRAETGRINIFNRRRKDVIDSYCRSQISIARKIARVLHVIFLRTELNGINEYRNDHFIGHFPRFANKAQVTFVESSHGWDKSDSLTIRAKFVADR